MITPDQQFLDPEKVFPGDGYPYHMVGQKGRRTGAAFLSACANTWAFQMTIWKTVWIAIEGFCAGALGGPESITEHQDISG